MKKNSPRVYSLQVSRTHTDLDAREAIGGGALTRYHIYIYIWTAGTKQAPDGSCCADGAAASMLFAIFISHHKTPANNRRITSYTDISPYSIWQYITINHAKYQSTRGYIKCKRRWCYRVNRVSIYVFRRRKWAVDARCAYLRYCAIGDRKIWRRWRGSINNYYV